MGVQMKLVLLFVLLSPLVRSSQESDTISNINQAQQSEKLLFEITTHGFLLWASMGLLMPIGILTIRMSITEECGKRQTLLFQIHAISQMIAVMLATSGAVMSFKNFNNSFNNNHQRIGVALYGIIWLQALIGFFRPKRESKRRGVWYLVHWMIGTSVSLMGIFSIYSGLQAYHEKTSRKIRIWISLFTAEICFFCFIYLFQDKWIYIQRQGVNLGHYLRTTCPTTHQLAPPKEKQKELALETC